MAWPGARRTYAGRVAAAAAAVPVVDPTSLRSGYNVAIDARQVAASLGLVDYPGPHLPARQRVDVGQFAPGLPVPADVLAKEHTVGYVPPTTGDSIQHPADPSGHVGAFAIGRGAIGHRRAFHGRIELGDPPGRGETESRG